MDGRSFPQMLAALSGPGQTSLTQLCRRCAAAFSVRAASISVVPGSGGVVEAVWWGQLARDAHDVEQVLGEGPVASAVDRWSASLVPDVASDTRWPGYQVEGAGAGVGSQYSFPVGVGGVHLAVLSLVDPGTSALDGVACREGLVAADVVAALLVGHRTGGPQGLLVPDDLVAQPSVVHRASGMVAVQSGCSPDTALVQMRARALGDGRRLEDLARDVVERKVRFEGGPEQE